MQRKFVCLAMTLLLCASLQRAFANGEGTSVTKENQAKLGIHFTLVAERIAADGADKATVLVTMEIPRKGKLKDLRNVTMSVGQGRPLVSATLQPRVGKDGSWIVDFSLASELADKCTIDLNMPYSEPLTYSFYSVELKGYVTDRK